MSVTGQMLDEADALAEDYRQALEAERAAHARTRAERDRLLALDETTRRWADDPEYDSCAFEDDLKPIFEAIDATRNNCRTCGTPNVPEAQFIGNRCGQCYMVERNAVGADIDWAKPEDQPATGPLRRKLALARGVLSQVLDAMEQRDELPAPMHLRAVLDETADP